MTLAEAILAYAVQLMVTTNHGASYDHKVMEETVDAIASSTDDLMEAETLIKIARYESGGFRNDVADCRTRGDHGAAQGIFQVHPFSKQEMSDTCSKDYRLQVAVALFHLRDSINICKMHGYRGSETVTIYTSGFCHHADGVSHSHYGNGKALQTLLYTEDNIILSKKGEIAYASIALKD